MTEFDKLVELKMEIDSLTHSAEMYKQLINNPTSDENTFRTQSENVNNLKDCQDRLIDLQGEFSMVLIDCQKKVIKQINKSIIQ